MKTSRHAPDKLVFWSQHIEQWKSSGLQKEYCAAHSLGLKSFGRWKRILALHGFPTVVRRVGGDAVGMV